MRIEVLDNGTLIVHDVPGGARQPGRHFVDGAGVPVSGHDRRAFTPGEDVSAEPQRVQAVAAAVWTADLIAAYKASPGGQAPAAAQTEATDKVERIDRGRRGYHGAA